MLTIQANSSALTDLYDIEAGLVAALQGKPHKLIAEAMGLTVSQYSRLRYSDDLFKKGIDRAREEGHEVIADSVLTIVEDNPGLMPQALKIKFDAIVTWLKWMNPEKYGDRMIVREELVDLRSALNEATGRVLNITPKPVDPFE